MRVFESKRPEHLEVEDDYMSDLSGISSLEDDERSTSDEDSSLFLSEDELSSLASDETNSSIALSDYNSNASLFSDDDDDDGNDSMIPRPRGKDVVVGVSV